MGEGNKDKAGPEGFRKASRNGWFGGTEDGWNLALEAGREGLRGTEFAAWGVF